MYTQCTDCPLPVQSARSGRHVQVSFYGGLPAFEPDRSPEDQGPERGSENYAGNLQVISMDHDVACAFTVVSLGCVSRPSMY